MLAPYDPGIEHLDDRGRLVQSSAVGQLQQTGGESVGLTGALRDLGTIEIGVPSGAEPAERPERVRSIGQETRPEQLTVCAVPGTVDSAPR